MGMSVITIGALIGVMGFGVFIYTTWQTGNNFGSDESCGYYLSNGECAYSGNSVLSRLSSLESSVALKASNEALTTSDDCQARIMAKVRTKFYVIKEPFFPQPLGLSCHFVHILQNSA